MGLPMALNLHKHGLLAAAWNRTAAKTVRLAAETGCRACNELSDLAAACDVIVVCVSGDADVLEVVAAMAPHLAHDTLIIDCSTVSAKTAREAAAMLSAVGARFVDCPVSGGTEGAWNGTLSLMAGGDCDDIDRARPALDAMGATITHMGPVGSGQATKATNQIMVAGINQAVSEAMAFGEANGLQIEDLIKALEGGAAASWFLTNRAPNMARGDFPLGFKVALHEKDLEICREMAAGLDVRLPIVEMTLLHYRRLLQGDPGEEDISSLFRLKSAMFTEADEG
jgi:3-hydroxyisobutyrate dehydrogenase